MLTIRGSINTLSLTPDYDLVVGIKLELRRYDERCREFHVGREASISLEMSPIPTAPISTVGATTVSQDTSGLITDLGPLAGHWELGDATNRHSRAVSAAVAYKLRAADRLSDGVTTLDEWARYGWGYIHPWPALVSATPTNVAITTQASIECWPGFWRVCDRTDINARMISPQELAAIARRGVLYADRVLEDDGISIDTYVRRA